MRKADRPTGSLPLFPDCSLKSYNLDLQVNPKGGGGKREGLSNNHLRFLCEFQIKPQWKSSPKCAAEAYGTVGRSSGMRFL